MLGSSSTIRMVGMLLAIRYPSSATCHPLFVRALQQCTLQYERLASGRRDRWVKRGLSGRPDNAGRLDLPGASVWTDPASGAGLQGALGGAADGVHQRQRAGQRLAQVDPRVDLTQL